MLAWTRSLTAKSSFLPASIHEYILSATLREDPLLRQLRKETARMPNAQMQIGPEQGQFMQLLAKAIRARSYLEIGVFTGYSSLAMALALPRNGRIVACDLNEQYLKIARRYWARAGVTSKIDVRLGPALKTLDNLRKAAKAKSFDMAFIDADKSNVGNYYERVLALLRPGGLLLIDNVLWDGKVIDAKVRDKDTRALRAIAKKAGRDQRVDVSMLSLCDGLLIALKK